MKKKSLIIEFDDLARFFEAHLKDWDEQDHPILGGHYQEDKPIESDNIDDTIHAYFLESQNWDMLFKASDTFRFEVEDKKVKRIILQWNHHPQATNMMINCFAVFDHIMAFSSWVFRSYEDELYPWEKDAWEEGYCSGDDDVDYNSSYLEAVIAIIEEYLIFKRLTKRELTHQKEQRKW